MIAPVPLEQLAAEENRTLSENIAALPDAYRFANNAVALLSNGITLCTGVQKGPLNGAIGV